MLRQSKHVDYFTLDVSTFITYVRLEFLKKNAGMCWLSSLRQINLCFAVLVSIFV